MYHIYICSPVMCGMDTKTEYSNIFKLSHCAIKFHFQDQFTIYLFSDFLFYALK